MNSARAYSLLLVLALCACDQLYVPSDVPSKNQLQRDTSLLTVWCSGYYPMPLGGGSQNIVQVFFGSTPTPWPQNPLLTLSIYSSSLIPVPTGDYGVEFPLNNVSPAHAEVAPPGADLSSETGTVSVTYSTKSEISGGVYAELKYLDGGTLTFQGNFNNVPLLCETQGC
jgi:hypothetical protein